MKPIQLIFFDIDGTSFYHEEFKVMESTIYALQQLQLLGIKTVLCTSRVKTECINLPQVYLDLMDVKVYGAGSHIEQGNQILAAHYVKSDEVKQVLDYCNDHHIVVRWANETQGHFDHHTQPEITKIFSYLYHMEPTLQAYAHEDITHLLLYPNAEQESQLRNLLKNASIIPFSRGIEVAAHGISKASAVEECANLLHIPLEHTMAFGDGKNDIDMLQKVQLGVAMGNASNEVKEVADEICERIEENGIYHALVRHNIIQKYKKEEEF